MIFESNRENILIGAELIKKGELVAFPTETVYGLGADATNPEAVSKIFAAKKRPFFDPLIVHIADYDKLRELTSGELSENANKIIKAFWPGPITLILPKSEKIPYLVTSGLESVAVRMPDNETALELIRNSSGAIAAPSANLFGRTSPTKAEHVFEQLGDSVQMIIDGGKCLVGVESTVVDLTCGVPTILRPGGISLEQLKNVVGKAEAIDRKDENVKAPGQLKNHYAPSIPLFIVSSLEEITERGGDIGYLAFSGKDYEGFGHVEVLSENGDFNEAAANLFDCLHRLDKSGVKKIFAERISEIGIGTAVADRLYKASFKE